MTTQTAPTRRLQFGENPARGKLSSKAQKRLQMKIRDPPGGRDEGRLQCDAGKLTASLDLGDAGHASCRHD